MVSAGNDYVGFNIKLLSRDGWVVFNSSEHPSAVSFYTNKPINTIPKPAALFLLDTTGLIGFMVKQHIV